jgi:hypothetical protein
MADRSSASPWVRCAAPSGTATNAKMEYEYGNFPIVVLLPRNPRRPPLRALSAPANARACRVGGSPIRQAAERARVRRGGASAARSPPARGPVLGPRLARTGGAGPSFSPRPATVERAGPSVYRRDGRGDGTHCACACGYSVGTHVIVLRFVSLRSLTRNIFLRSEKRAMVSSYCPPRLLRKSRGAAPRARKCLPPKKTDAVSR